MYQLPSSNPYLRILKSIRALALIIAKLMLPNVVCIHTSAQGGDRELGSGIMSVVSNLVQYTFVCRCMRVCICFPQAKEVQRSEKNPMSGSTDHWLGLSSLIMTPHDSNTCTSVVSLSISS